jgi:uncharacterized coiled-coil DUF342 family protein
MSKLIVYATVSVGVFAFVVIALASAPVYAANPSITPKTNQIVQEIQEKRCTRISSFIDTRIERYNENKDRHIQNHKRILEKIQNLVTSLQSKGFDVNQLKSDFNSLNALTNSFAFEYANFIGILENAKQLGCGESEGAFKTKMDESRVALKTSRDKAQEIWKYINTVIRKDLNELRVQANIATDNI